MSTRTRHAEALFAGIAPEYERMGRLLSFGQDPRWRRFLVSRVATAPGSMVLDVASGTGLVARGLRGRGYRVLALDPSEAMLRAGEPAGPKILGRAEEIPFADAGIDALTFTSSSAPASARSVAGGPGCHMSSQIVRPTSVSPSSSSSRSRPGAK